MASSLETQVLFDYQLDELDAQPDFRRNEAQPTRVKPEIYKPAKVKPESAPARKNYSKMTIGLMGLAFTLLAGEAIIYFHSVQVQKNSNLMQSKIVEIKEQNYRLNVELAKTKELSKVEQVAINNLQMKSSINSKINYLVLPEKVIKKEYMITRVAPDKQKLSIPIGF